MHLSLEPVSFAHMESTLYITRTLGHMTYCGHCMIYFVYHIFIKYNCECGIIYVVRFVL